MELKKKILCNIIILRQVINNSGQQYHLFYCTKYFKYLFRLKLILRRSLFFSRCAIFCGCRIIFTSGNSLLIIFLHMNRHRRIRNNQFFNLVFGNIFVQYFENRIKSIIKFKFEIEFFF